MDVERDRRGLEQARQSAAQRLGGKVGERQLDRSGDMACGKGFGWAGVENDCLIVPDLAFESGKADQPPRAKARTSRSKTSKPG